MSSCIRSLSSDCRNVRQDVFPIEQWTVTARKGIIMQSKCTCPNPVDMSAVQENICSMCLFSKQLPKLPSVPEMLFNNNLLRLEHYSGLAIEFNPLDALKQVQETRDPLKVAVADGWQNARASFPFAKSVLKPFDWTFTTDYKGTLISSNRKSKSKAGHSSDSSTSIEAKTTEQTETASDNSEVLNFMVEETIERIDINKLKERSDILFYENLTLYEDELADHGVAQYGIKVRVMPKSFFVLARYYLRIDGVLARINDTRIYHEFNKRYLLREYTNREAKLETLDLPISTVIDPNELMNHLPLMKSHYEKLTLPRLR